MTVFRICLKILKKNILPILFLLGIGTFLAIYMTRFTGQNAQTDLAWDKIKISVINQDGSQDLLNGLFKSLEPYVEFVDMEYEEGMIEDSIFYQVTEYALIIPQGFSQSVSNGEAGGLQKITGESSYNSIFIDNIIDNYLHEWMRYEEQNPALDSEAILMLITDSLAKEGKVQLLHDEEQADVKEQMARFYNILSYPCLGIMMLFSSCSIQAFYAESIKRRIASTTASYSQIMFQLIGGNLLVMGGICGFGGIAGLIVFGQQLISLTGGLLLLNYGLYSLCSLSIGILLGIILKTTIPALWISNIVALGISFLGSAFFPQMLFNAQLQSIGLFLPSYWFVQLNEMIINSAAMNREFFAVFGYHAIVIMSFTSAFLSVGMLCLKNKERHVVEERI